MRRLVLIRHAHRDTSSGSERDNGLSERGLKQVRRLSDFALDRYGEADLKNARFLSSPSRRCRETLEPLTVVSEAELKIDDLLSEGGNCEEKTSEFRYHWLRREEDLTILCSHGDWIPHFLASVGVSGLHIKKGCITELSYDGRHYLVDLHLASLKHL